MIEYIYIMIDGVIGIFIWDYGIVLEICFICDVNRVWLLFTYDLYDTNIFVTSFTYYISFKR
jgi:hypothetical protein